MALVSELVTVCVVTLNHSSYIEDCLLSVLAQSGVRIELLVGDDGSTDDTATLVEDIAAQYPDIVTLYRHQKNLGAAANYQFLVERATGQFIAHLDGDDFWMPGKLRKQLDHFAQQPDCVGVYANAIVLSETGSPVGVFNNKQPATFDSDYLLERGNFLHHGTLLYMASMRQVVLSIDSAFIDYQIHLRLSEHGKLGYVNSLLAAYRIGHQGTMTGSTPTLVLDLYWQALVESLLRKRGSSVSRKALRFFVANILVRYATTRLAPSPLQVIARIQDQLLPFSTVDMASSALGAMCIIWTLIRSRLSGAIAGHRFRVLFRR